MKALCIFTLPLNLSRVIHLLLLTMLLTVLLVGRIELSFQTASQVLGEGGFGEAYTFSMDAYH